MSPGPSERARQGLSESRRLYWRFWKSGELRTRAAEEALQDIAALDDCKSEPRLAIEMARSVAGGLSAPEARLEALRLGLEVLSRGAPLGAPGLAALAMSLTGLDRSRTRALAELVPSEPLQNLLKAGAEPSRVLDWTAGHPSPEIGSYARACLELRANPSVAAEGLALWGSRPDVAGRLAQLAGLQDPNRGVLCRATLEALARDEPLDARAPAWALPALKSLPDGRAGALWALEDEIGRHTEHAPYLSYLRRLVQAGGEPSACLELACHPDPPGTPQRARAALLAGPAAYPVALESLEEGARAREIAPRLSEKARQALQRQCLEDLAGQGTALPDLEWGRAALELPEMDESSGRTLARWVLERARPQNRREAAWQEFHRCYGEAPELAPQVLRHLPQEPDFALRMGLLSACSLGPESQAALRRESPPPELASAWAVVAACAGRVPGPAVQAGLGSLPEGPDAVARAFLGASPETARPLLDALPANVRTGFLCEIADHTPLLDPGGRSRCLKRALEHHLSQPAAPLAEIGLRAARAAGNLQDKLHLAELTLEAVAAQQGGTVRQAVTVLRRLVREPTPGLDNSLWYRTAVAMAAVRSVARALPLTPLEACLTLSRELRNTAWAPAPWLVKTYQRGLESAGFQPPDADPTWQTADRFQALLEEVTGGAAALLQEGPSGTITREADSVTVGGVRVPRRGASRPAELARAVAAPPSTPSESPRVNYTLDGVTLDEGAALVPIEVRTSLGSAACYSPSDGKFHKAPSSTSAVAYNPRTGTVESQGHSSGGAAGVYDPGQGSIVWKKRYKNGVAGYYDATARQPHFEQACNNGVGFAEDPERGWIKGVRYKNGAAGAWDPVAGELRWDFRYHRSASAAGNDPECPTLSGPSFHHQSES